MTSFELEQLADLVADRVVMKIAGQIGRNGDGWINGHEAAEILGCSLATIERRVRDGDIPSAKVGRLRRFRREEILGLSTKEGQQ